MAADTRKQSGGLFSREAGERSELARRADTRKQSGGLFSREAGERSELAGASESRKFVAKPIPGSPKTHRLWGGAMAETDSSDYFGIFKK